MIPLLAACIVLTSSIAPPTPVAKIEWQSSYEAALRTAAAEKRVVFVALDHAGEGRSEHFLKKLTRDKEVVALAAQTLNVAASRQMHKKSGACPRFKEMECADHRRAEASLRESVLPENDEGVVAVPQYLWLNGQGQILLSVAYELDREGLLWCFQRARQLIDPEGAPPIGEEARPPRRLLMGHAFRATPGDKYGRGMTADELEAALSESKKSIFGMADRSRTVRVMFTDEKDAVEYVKVELSGMLRLFAGGRVPQTVRTLGLISPSPFWEVLEDFAKLNDPEARHETAVALEQLGASDALRLVKSGLKREKDEGIVGAWVRALGACGATDKGTRKALLGFAEDDEPEDVRASAVFALGYLQRHEDVRAHWRALLSDGSPALRLAAACGAALARDVACLPAVEAAATRAEGEEQAALERALAVLRGGDLYPLADDVKRITRDRIPRLRVFFGSPPASRAESEDRDEG